MLFNTVHNIVIQFQEAIGIVTNKVERSWHISETLFKDLDLNPDSLSYPVKKVRVVECPDEFVKAKMEIRIWKDDKGNAERFQPMNMKNPILGMSMSEDGGGTWTTMREYGDTDSFLSPSELRKGSNNQTLIRVESWMGSSNVLFSSRPGALWTAGQDGFDGGNNIWRGIFRFTQVVHKISKSLKKTVTENIHCNLLKIGPKLSCALAEKRCFRRTNSDFQDTPFFVKFLFAIFWANLACGCLGGDLSYGMFPWLRF